MAAFLNVRASKYYPERTNCREQEYKKIYRFTKYNVEWLAEHFLGNSDEKRGGALCPERKMRIFLRFVSDSGFKIGIGKIKGFIGQQRAKLLTQCSVI